ncbi:metalloregulator ArsR/SmtB family transcription factor [Arthrobacter sp. H20]|uniref:ArsR/SmtB family transcription factor n=1 Tax=Arthrobacter sp. H20 TaxID=1267981 RepID=UPI0006860B2E|nr:metalloregulator ArsR/SmtB family transcription factor [Arthrobacter sp. H20]
MHECLHVYVIDDVHLEKVAELFKMLGTASRLRILTELANEPSSVGSLAESTRLSQPLVSQHLRVLRGINLVTVSRSGRDAIYSLSDDHVAHVINDAISHTQEPATGTTAAHGKEKS